MSKAVKLESQLESAQDPPAFEIAKLIWLISGPLLFTILILLNPWALDDGASKVVAAFAWMLVWWITETVPLAVTALLPIVLFSSTGVMTLDEAVAPYSNKVIYLFFGGFVLALGLEEHNLHKRIALKIVGITGLSPNRLILGFLLSTAAISMWISNTATTVMMLPMALSVLAVVNRENEDQPELGNGATGNAKLRKRFSIALILSIAYGATIGGMGTVIGTPPNIVMRGYFEGSLGIEVPFFTWMMWAMPIVVVLLALNYVLFVYVLFPTKGLKLQSAAALMVAEREKLGPLTLPQSMMMLIFLATAIAWMFRDLVMRFFLHATLSDETVALIAAIAVFTLPYSLRPYKPLLSWEATKRLPWGILLLFGGGFCLADAFDRTGVLSILVNQFKLMGQGQGWLTLILLAGLTVYVSEVMSNVALVNVLIPIICSIAIGMGIDPIVLAFPVTLAASCGFMLPMATPPNAIVFASGQVTIREMVWAGFWLDLISLAVIVLLTVWRL